MSEESMFEKPDIEALKAKYGNDWPKSPEWARWMQKHSPTGALARESGQPKTLGPRTLEDRRDAAKEKARLLDEQIAQSTERKRLAAERKAARLERSLDRAARAENGIVARVAALELKVARLCAALGYPPETA
jgi:hypothetical protein